MKRLSCPIVQILVNRNVPSLPAHTSTISAAITYLKESDFLMIKVKIVKEMKVKLPVRSKYFSVL